MNTGTIVVGVDGSADSYAALSVASRLAERLDARLVLAHVGNPAYLSSGAFAATGSLGPMPRGSEDIEVELRAGEAMLEQVAEATGLDHAERRVLTGLAAERLADLADDEAAELIVVGSRGRGAFRSAFLGSVSNSLVGVARCPVLIVPPGAGIAVEDAEVRHGGGATQTTHEPRHDRSSLRRTDGSLPPRPADAP
jgi:nucleotide-binding universal stress UspA family protein